MTAPKTNPISDEDLKRFDAYHDKHPAWGSLHVVLEDGNVSDDNVKFCIEYAKNNEDAEGEYLAKVLLITSRSQRVNLRNRFPKSRSDTW